MGSSGHQNPWAPYDSYKDCSQGICSIYCPQWCYIIGPPPPPFDFPESNDDNSSPTDFSPLFIAVIGIFASAFILITYYTIISKYCRRRGSDGGSRGLEMDHNSNPNHQGSESSWQGSTNGLDESLIKSIKVHKYVIGDKLVEGTECSVCLSEFEENESLRLLPKCSHAFHVKCIDTWLKSHSSCPLCRLNITGPAIAMVPHHPQQMPSPVDEETPQQQEEQQSVSRSQASEYQHRSNGSVLVVQDLEEGVVSLGNGTCQDLRASSFEIRGVQDYGVIRSLRRSASLNSSLCQGQACVSIADVLDLNDSEDDEEDLENQMGNNGKFSRENVQFSMEIGTSKRGVEEHNSKFNNCSSRSSGVFSLVKGPLLVKRSISTGRFVFTRGLTNGCVEKCYNCQLYVSPATESCFAHCDSENNASHCVFCNSLDYGTTRVQ